MGFIRKPKKLFFHQGIIRAGRYSTPAADAFRAFAGTVAPAAFDEEHADTVAKADDFAVLYNAVFGGEGDFFFAKIKGVDAAVVVGVGFKFPFAENVVLFVKLIGEDNRLFFGGEFGFVEGDVI